MNTVTIKRISRRIFGNFFFVLLDVKKKLLPHKADKNEQIALKKREKLFSGFVQKGDLVFDVGANMGNRTGPLLNIGAKVIAIEPQAVCLKYLKRKFGNKITLIECGLSNKEETRQFFLSDETVFSSFSREWIDSVKNKRLRKYKWNKSMQVRMTTLDCLIKIYGIPVFIKIDVEGFELEVLQGLSQKIKMISYEYTTPEQLLKAQQCIEYLTSIAPNLECNYSIGETMKFELDAWVSAPEMLALITTEKFTNTRFGDIYVRML